MTLCAHARIGTEMVGLPQVAWDKRRRAAPIHEGWRCCCGRGSSMERQPGGIIAWIVRW